MNVAKQATPRIFTALWIVGLVLFTLFDLSIPPARVPIFMGLAIIASIPAFFGTRNYKVFGIAAIIVSLVLTCWEYKEGLSEKSEKERMRQKIAEQRATNSVTTLNVINEPTNPR